MFLEEDTRNRKRDIVLGTWNVRSLYRAGSLKAVARELNRYKLDFWWGNLRERDHWGDRDIDGRIILRWIFRKWEEIGTDRGHL